MAKKKDMKLVIGVMSSSTSKELKNESIEKGADFYLEKSNKVKIPIIPTN